MKVIIERFNILQNVNDFEKNIVKESREILVSVIIPVYNVENYLSKCVDSLINQSYKNIEIILVDDGSQDNSGNICDEYAKNDSRIKVIHTENQGVSSARNIGLIVSSGVGICFVDSDDTVHVDYIYILVSPWLENLSDISICSIRDIYIGKEICRDIGIEHSGNFFEDYHKIINVLRGPVAKLYRKDIITQNRIIFPLDVERGEDQIWNFQYYLHVSKYNITSKALYNYFHRDVHSLSKSLNPKTYFDNLKKLEKEKEFFKTTNIKKWKNILNQDAFYCLENFAIVDYERNSYQRFKGIIEDIIKYIDINNYINLKQRVICKFLKYKLYILVYYIYVLRNLIK